MESTDWSSGGGGGSQQELHPQLPPGFRFHPTDEELVVHYLRKKAASAPLPGAIIADVDLYKFDPWELPGKASFGEEEWYFFSPRDRKYPNGARPNRAATSGYWKATGTDKPILASSGGTQKVVGVKKALVFYGGKPPKGVKTNWIMHEYRLSDSSGSMSSSIKISTTAPPPGVDAASSSKENNTNKRSLRLDDWVLCRIYQKNSGRDYQQRLLSELGRQEKGINGDRTDDGGQDHVIMYYKSPAPPLPIVRHHVAAPRRPTSRVRQLQSGYTANCGALQHLDNHENLIFVDGLLAAGSVPELANQYRLPHHVADLHGTSSEPELVLSMLPGSLGSVAVLPSKRGLSSATTIWDEAAGAPVVAASPAGKRQLVQSCSSDVSGTVDKVDAETHLLVTTDEDGNNNGCSCGGNEGSPSMMATLLGHLQRQGAPDDHHQHSAMLSAIGEGVFVRQPYDQLHGINWGS